jgi:hypothetical protein
MFLVFNVFSLLGLLPFAARITAVSLGGTAIAVMMAFNIAGDVAIARRMFSAPGAYLHALTPAPRRQILFSSVITMMAMDIVTMAAVIMGEVLLSFSLAGEGVGNLVREAIMDAGASNVLFWFWSLALLIAGYLLIIMIILFCISARKSVLYSKPGGGLLTAALAVAISYIVNMLPLVLAPFGDISRFAVFFTISLNRAGSVMFILLTLIEAAILFALTSRLLERKVNI